MLTIKNQANRSILVLVCAMLQDQLQKLLEVLCVGGVRRHHQGPGQDVAHRDEHCDRGSNLELGEGHVMSLFHPRA